MTEEDAGDREERLEERFESIEPKCPLGLMEKPRWITLLCTINILIIKMLLKLKLYAMHMHILVNCTPRKLEKQSYLMFFDKDSRVCVNIQTACLPVTVMTVRVSHTELYLAFFCGIPDGFLFGKLHYRHDLMLQKILLCIIQCSGRTDFNNSRCEQASAIT